ncbi:MAG: hypothetical protein AB8B55_10420 [Mariniblastus sp.]
MRTKLNDWLKFSIALITAVAISGMANAEDEVVVEKEKQESAKARLVRERRMNTISKTQTPAKDFEPVEMFSAMSQGDIEVIIKANSSAKANIIVKNNSDKPLAIEMPAAFSTVPVMRQGGFGGGGQGGGGFGGGQGGGQGGGNQAGGGGFGGGGGGGGFGGGGGGNQGGGGGAGIFNIPPGRVGKVAVKIVCLEEGKPDPKTRIAYKIQPLKDFTTNPQIFEMMRMLANDEISQPVAQAAAWNVTDGLSWQRLAVKNRIERMDGSYERYFAPQHIYFAQRVVTATAERAELRAKSRERIEPSQADYNNAN